MPGHRNSGSPGTHYLIVDLTLRNEIFTLHPLLNPIVLGLAKQPKTARLNPWNCSLPRLFDLDAPSPRRIPTGPAPPRPSGAAQSLPRAPGHPSKKTGIRLQRNLHVKDMLLIDYLEKHPCDRTPAWFVFGCMLARSFGEPFGHPKCHPGSK